MIVDEWVVVEAVNRGGLQRIERWIFVVVQQLFWLVSHGYGDGMVHRTTPPAHSCATALRRQPIAEPRHATPRHAVSAPLVVSLSSHQSSLSRSSSHCPPVVSLSRRQQSVFTRQRRSSQPPTSNATRFRGFHLVGHHVNVFASMVEPKLANTIIRRLNQVAPLENLRHVKRIQKKFLEGGKTQLSMILCLADENDNRMNSLPQDVQELVNSYQLSPFITKVCKNAALSKEEWEEQCKLWPTSYHPPTYNIDGITSFNEDDSQSIFSFMKSAVELAKSGDGSIVNAAVIVDPSIKQEIASACDQICCCSISTEKNSLESCSEQPEVLSSDLFSNGESNHTSLPPNDFPSETRKSYSGVSCLNPWQWAQENSHTTSCYWHPLRHAAMAAIQSSAARDRLLFPGMGHEGDKPNGVHTIQPTSIGILLRANVKFCLFLCYYFQSIKSAGAGRAVENSEELDPSAGGFHPESARPYLCTGYDIYLVWEPCVMCAMALVHQRIRRIFYAFPNPNEGALGSVHRLQGEKSLNHHYAVFRVLLPKEILNKNEVVAARTSTTNTNATTVCQ
ncbi:tRNA-specific adenosine deaminase TAD3 [Citrus sinensis]|uniref:tRNA-specific adenosine deaminase TAD3 n=1 Tax=Citrus sinensis TaxID=2711 RepID=A0ACB8LYM7_CITSI|nr:tRNA-specific adenosine deaminase TAD3 [Citrus sinensis]